jgi:hypothetical protein
VALDASTGEGKQGMMFNIHWLINGM